MKLPLVLLLVLGIGSLVYANRAVSQCCVMAEEVEPASGGEPSDDTPDSEAAYYCPMHPEVTSDEPGECPKCGMELVKQEQEKVDTSEEEAPSSAKVGTGSKEKQRVGTSPGKVGQATLPETYFCPTHPEVIYNEPGRCPQCGMKLEKRESLEKAPYFCPMHPGLTSERPRKCPKCGMKMEKWQGEEKTAYFCPMHPGVTSDKPGKCTKCGMKLVEKKVDKQKAAFYCPMHPEVTSDKPGQCPKCGMDLVKKKAEKQKKQAVTYYCPMHPEVTSDKPGECPKCGMDLVKKKGEAL